MQKVQWTTGAGQKMMSNNYKSHVQFFNYYRNGVLKRISEQTKPFIPDAANTMGKGGWTKIDVN